MSKLIFLIKSFLQFIFSLYQSRDLILSLIKRDFKSRFSGSYLSFVWAFVQPAVTILIMWFVFQVGFKAPPVGDVPFVLWLLSGIIPWFFLSESLSGATNSIIEYNFLVKKVVFRVSVLPIIKIASALMIHLFFILVIFAAQAFYGFPLTLHSIQVFYYLPAAVLLILGLSWLTSSIVVFVRDVGQVVGMLLQFGFWITPIFWNVKIIPEKYAPFVKLNPFFYIVEGYRNSFILRVWFWEQPFWTAYFWFVTLGFFVLGALIFMKLRPHFADVI